MSRVVRDIKVFSDRGDGQPREEPGLALSLRYCELDNLDAGTEIVTDLGIFKIVKRQVQFYNLAGHHCITYFLKKSI